MYGSIPPVTIPTPGICHVFLTGWSIPHRRARRKKQFPTPVVGRDPGWTWSRVTQNLGAKKISLHGRGRRVGWLFLRQIWYLSLKSIFGQAKNNLAFGSCKLYLLLNTVTLFLTSPKNKSFDSFTKKFSSRVDQKCSNFGQTFQRLRSAHAKLHVWSRCRTKLKPLKGLANLQLRRWFSFMLYVVYNSSVTQLISREF